jgi:hypothetical protein
MTLDRAFLTEYIGAAPRRFQTAVDEGLRTILQL